MAVALSESFAARTKELATHLQLPLWRPEDTDNTSSANAYDFHLIYENSAHNGQPYLSLVSAAGDLGSPFFIDFAHGQLAHRRQFGGGRGQPLARAVGLKGGANPTVIDATAGMGRDAFVLASLGASVTLIERSPILAALLEDALSRAASELEPSIPARMKLINANAIPWLQACAEEQCPDVIYLDPMYPHRSKSALVKKEMRILRALVGDDEDAGELLQVALMCAKKRVVVKRPKTAAIIISPTNEKLRPSATVESKNTRYDIYHLN